MRIESERAREKEEADLFTAIESQETFFDDSEARMELSIASQGQKGLPPNQSTSTSLR
jgi:predicted naringenin-chalcone synthase